MHNNLYKVKLKDILSVKRGASLSGQYYATEGDKIRLTLGNFNYPNGGFKENTSKENIYFTGPVRNEYILHKGDIITPLTEQVAGLLGETARIPVDNTYIQSGDIGLIIPKKDKLYKGYAYYLISSKSIKYQLGATAQQTKIRHTSPKMSENCIAWIPNDLVVQKNISDFLDNINNKIILNNKINQELEQMAKTLYNYWFVQFDFPDEKGRPYKSANGKMVYNEVLKREIPEGWEVKNIKDLCNVVTGKEDANFATSNGKYAFFTCGDDVLKCDSYAFEGKAVLVAGNGNFNVKYYEGCFNAYQRTYVLFPKNTDYIGMMHKSLIDSIKLFTQGANGSIVKFITKGDIENTKVIIPDNTNLLYPLNLCLSKIDTLKKENMHLAYLRDFLLPLLMNGQVSVQS